MKSKKFIGMLIGVIVLTAVLILALIFAKESVSAGVLVAFIFVIGFLITAYIGGNVFKSFITSKYFNEKLFDKGKENE